MNDAAASFDGRVVSGPAIAGFMWFDISEPMITLSGDDGGHPPLAMHHDIVAAQEVRLETPHKALTTLKGALSIGRRWDDRYDTRGFLRRDGSEYYTVSVDMPEAEWQETMRLLSWGFLPRTLELQFDVHHEQHFDGDDYWDDVRYPSVPIHQYRLDWTPGGTGQLRSRHYRG